VRAVEGLDGGRVAVVPCVGGEKEGGSELKPEGGREDAGS